MSHNWGATARARARVVPRSRERLNRLRSNLVQRWGPVSRVACKSQLVPTLHVRTCRVMVPDLKNGWADCVQIWCADRDRLVGCRASQLEAHPRSSARAGLSLSLACLSPQEASCWLTLARTCYFSILELIYLIFTHVGGCNPHMGGCNPPCHFAPK